MDDPSFSIFKTDQVSRFGWRQISVGRSVVVEDESYAAEDEGGHGEEGSGRKRNGNSESVKRKPSGANVAMRFPVLRIGLVETAEAKNDNDKSIPPAIQLDFKFALNVFVNGKVQIIRKHKCEAFSFQCLYRP